MTVSPALTTWQTLATFITEDLGRKPDAGELAPDTPLVESGLIDSLSILRLVVLIEQRLGVQIRPDEVVLENFATPVALARLVDAKLAAPETGS